MCKAMGGAVLDCTCARLWGGGRGSWIACMQGYGGGGVLDCMCAMLNRFQLQPPQEAPGSQSDAHKGPALVKREPPPTVRGNGTAVD